MKLILKSIIFLFIGLFASVGTLAQDSPKKKVAVYVTGNEVEQSIRKVVGAKLVSAITSSGEYAAVERTADFLAALAAENDYQTSGEVRDSQIAQLGQKFGVKFVVVADLSEIFDELFIASRLINVETGLVERAHDVNGPAESMNQLVTLSQGVASGLLNGVSSASSSGFSNRPVNMALCAVDQNGNTVYIKADQWERMSESQRIGYMKKGVCLLNNGECFLVAMRDTGKGDWYYACRNNAPAKWQLELMFNCKEQLNTALRIFGGSPFEEEWYWSNDSFDSSVAWFVSMGGSYVDNAYKTGTNRVRAVAAVPVASAINNPYKLQH